MSADEQETRTRLAIRDAFLAAAGGASQGYKESSGQLARVLEIVREEVASTIQEPLNERAAQMPQRTYEQKKTLANWINTELRRFGLAIRCPKTGHPSLIQANPGDSRETGRFRLDYVDDDGRRHNTVSSVSLPRMDLMPDRTRSVPHRTRSSRSP